MNEVREANLNLWQRFRKNYWLSLLFDALLLVAVFLAISAWQARDLLPEDGRELAPDFSLPDRQGRLVTLSEYRGKRVLVYFLAPWCTVCGLSVHNLVDVAAERDPQLEILAVGVEYESADEIWAFADEHKLTMPVLLGGAEQMRDWQIKAFPTYYVLDEDGMIIARSVGYSTEIGIRWRTRERGRDS